MKNLLKNSSIVITVLIFAYICVLCFSNLVSVCPQKFSLAQYTSKCGVAYKPMLYSGHLNFILFALYIVEYTWHPGLFPSTCQCFLSCVRSLKLTDGWALSFLPIGLSLRHPCHLLYYISLT